MNSITYKMNKISLIFLFATVWLTGCNNGDDFGTYLSKHDGLADTLVINRDGTFHHVVYHIERERIIFTQDSTYKRVGTGFTFNGFKMDALSTQDHWDTDMDSYFFRKAIPRGFETDWWFIKQ